MNFNIDLNGVLTKMLDKYEGSKTVRNLINSLVFYIIFVCIGWVYSSY